MTHTGLILSLSGSLVTALLKPPKVLPRQTKILPFKEKKTQQNNPTARPGSVVIHSDSAAEAPEAALGTQGAHGAHSLVEWMIL